MSLAQGRPVSPLHHAQGQNSSSQSRPDAAYRYGLMMDASGLSRGGSVLLFPVHVATTAEVFIWQAPHFWPPQRLCLPEPCLVLYNPDFMCHSLAFYETPRK